MSQKHIERSLTAHRLSTNVTPSPRRKVEAYSDFSGNPIRPSLVPLSAKNILYLQRIIGNQAVTSLMKSIHSAPNSVQRAPYNRVDGSCILSDVTETPNKITMTGKLRIDAENVADINSNLDYHLATVPLSKLDDTAWFGSSRSAKVLEISVVQAQPLGKRIGYVLAYHLGLVAREQKIDYIIAKNVTAAREPFYNPLGFRDAMDEPRWADLVNEKDQIENTIRQNVNVPNLAALIDRKKAIVDLMEKNTIFISTTQMIQNAQNGFNGHWVAG